MYIVGGCISESEEASMKMFTDCSGECCICACGDFCLAGHGDDDFYPASTEVIVKRLDVGKYASYRNNMINELKNRGIDYTESE